MREARPKPFPEVLVAGTEGESNVAAELPSDASVGYAPGWRPGIGPQPGTEARLEIAPDDPLYEILLGGEQPQTSPPFGPPGFPVDYGNYAPFNRFTWNQGNTLVYPVSVVGKLFFTQRGQNFVCSASVIHRDTLATAGHCVHDGSNSAAGWSTNVLFCPSLNPAGHPAAAGRVFRSSHHSNGLPPVTSIVTMDALSRKPQARLSPTAWET
jgi:hypothetical protein